MPAHSLTSNCIWNSFHNSNKRHIIITGNRGSGKTTLLHKLFPDALPGITTWAQPQTAVYLKENTTNSITKVGVFDASLAGSENKMQLYGNGFSELGIKALNNALLAESEWISIDEIGYLESQSTDYLNQIAHIMKKKHIIAVVRKQNLSHLQSLCDRDDVFLIDLDKPFGDMGCIIMASGLGKRFGKNKLLTDFCGKPLISYILDVTSGLFPKRIVVTRHAEVAKLCEHKNIDVVLHALPHQNDTIRLGLDKIIDTKHCMFCTADQPLLQKDTITSLALLSINAPHKIIRPIYGSTPGSPVIFPQWAFEDLLHLPEGNGGGYIIKQYPDSVQHLSIDNSYELEDIDTIEDLIRLQEKARSIY